MDPTIFLYGAMALAGANNARNEEKKREEELEERDKFWDEFHDDMDRTFKRGRHSER